MIAGWGSAAAAEDVTFRLARELKKPDVVYVLTNDAEAKQLGLNDTDWRMFLTGRLAADPPGRTAEEEPLFHQAFDPSTTVSDELLPGFAALNAINEIDQIPRGQLVEVLVREPEKFDSEMKLAAESIETMMGGAILGGLYGILKERAFDQFKGYAGYAEMFADMEIGRVDAIVAPDTAAANFIREKPGVAEIVGEPYRVRYVGVPMQKGSTELKAAVDEAIREMREKGLLDEWAEQYFGIEHYSAALVDEVP